MFCFVLKSGLEPEVRRCLERHGPPEGYVIERGTTLTVGINDADRAALFLNLFDGEIERSFERRDGQSAA